ncbi:MAG TPA: aminotransferase class V-fold PLP-dependent enzyme [Acidimicrobiales bacterium]|nr:aminotransferase class V-fold PLP-dependent enzyme [Acidimicrobiales bacterium]
MTAGRHYLDHASTTPLRPESRAAMSEWLERAGRPDGVGDPGRVHSEGRLAREAVERARQHVAELLGTQAARVVFTSGGTEAANTAILAAAAANPGRPLAAAEVEHSCVRQACRRSGRPVLVPAVDADGRLDLGDLDRLLATEQPALVNCQMANHEVGTLQPVVEAIARSHAAGALVHVDAAAAAGHVDVAFDALEADFMSVSAHKLGGPPGIGALLVRRRLRMTPMLVGGSEERGRRAGGENVLGIVGFGAACEALADGGLLAAEAARSRAYTKALAAAAEAVPAVAVVGDRDARAPHILALSVAGVLGEAVLLSLDRAGIACHSGSACSSEVLEPSPVLAAMGLDPDRSLRLSVGWSTSAGDVDAFGEAFPSVVERLRSLGTG